jgi:hypothetical protein
MFAENTREFTDPTWNKRDRKCFDERSVFLKMV